MMTLEGTWHFKTSTSGDVFVNKKSSKPSYVYLISKNEECPRANCTWFGENERSITKDQYKILRNVYLFMFKIDNKVNSVNFTNNNSFIIN